MSGIRDHAGRDRGPLIRRGDAPQAEGASPEDRTAVVALWRVCDLTRPWNDPDRDFTQALEGVTSAILIVRDGDTIAASVMVGFDGHRGWVYYLAVAPDVRRGGLGRALMVAAEAWLVDRNAPKIQLMVRDSNEAASAFYTTLGFERQAVATWGRFLDGKAG